MNGVFVGGGLLAAAAFLARSSSSFGRYLGPNEDEHTVAQEFVKRLEHGFNFARQYPEPGLIDADKVKKIRIASQHRNFNIDRAYDFWFETCMRGWKGPGNSPSPWDMTEEEFGDHCDGEWDEMIESYDFSVCHHMQRGTL